LDLYLGEFFDSPPSFFLSYSSIASIALVELGIEGLEHFCSFHLHWLHQFEFSMVIQSGESKKLITLGCLYLEHVPHGSVDSRKLGGATELKHCGVKLGSDSWEPPIKLWMIEHRSPCMVLVINDNLYGVMFVLSYI
jgi:hypothetical protein